MAGAGRVVLRVGVRGGIGQMGVVPGSRHVERERPGKGHPPAQVDALPPARPGARNLQGDRIERSLVGDVHPERRHVKLHRPRQPFDRQLPRPCLERRPRRITDHARRSAESVTQRAQQREAAREQVAGAEFRIHDDPVVALLGSAIEDVTALVVQRVEPGAEVEPEPVGERTPPPEERGGRGVAGVVVCLGHDGLALHVCACQ